MKFHLLLSSKYITTADIPEDLSGALTRFQQAYKVSNVHMFTVIDEQNGVALSQRAFYLPDDELFQGALFRHEAQKPSPSGVPSYEELLAIVRAFHN